MVHNFESWRTATQSAHKPAGVSHYHLCSDTTFFEVASLLQALCVSFVDKKQITLSPCLVDTVLQFLDEMQYAYMHPRSTSARFAFRMVSATH